MPFRASRDHNGKGDSPEGGIMGMRTAIEVVQRATRAAGLGQRTDAQLLDELRERKDPIAFEALVRRWLMRAANRSAG